MSLVPTRPARKAKQAIRMPALYDEADYAEPSTGTDDDDTLSPGADDEPPSPSLRRRGNDRSRHHRCRLGRRRPIGNDTLASMGDGDDFAFGGDRQSTP
jgi:hypothetical protein